MSKVLDESGFDFNYDDYMAEKLTTEDVQDTLDDFLYEFDDACDCLEDLLNGLKYTAASDSLKRVITELTSGYYLKFAKENSFLSNPSDKSEFLKINTPDRKAVCDLYFCITNSESFRLRYKTLLMSIMSKSLESSYKAIKYENKMFEIAGDEEITSIKGAFKDFDKFMTYLNSSSVLKAIPGTTITDYKSARNLDAIKTFIDSNICNYPNLSKYIESLAHTNSMGANELTVIDRETSNFEEFAKNYDRIKKDYEECLSIHNALKANKMSGISETFFSGFNNLLSAFERVLEKALEVIDEFRGNSSDAPYAIQHYPSEVTSVLSKYDFETVSPSDKHGTKYKQAIWEMQFKLETQGKALNNFFTEKK